MPQKSCGEFHKIGIQHPVRVGLPVGTIHMAATGARWPWESFMSKNTSLSRYCAVAMATVGTIFEPEVVMGRGRLLTSSAGAP